MPMKTGPTAGLPVALDRQRGVVPVGDPVVLAQGHPHVQHGRRPAAVRAQALDRAHYLGVQPEAGVEGEVPGSGQAEADAAVPARCQAGQDLPGCVDRVSGQPEGAGEDVGAAAGQRSERGPAGRRGCRGRPRWRRRSR